MEIEALATARTLEFAQSILEGNSKLIIKGLVEKGRSLAPYDLLVQDARIIFLGFLLNYFTLMLKEKIIRLLIV